MKRTARRHPRPEKGAGEARDGLFPPGECLHLLPVTIHQAESLEESMIIEESTLELRYGVRLKDEYGREGPKVP